MLKLYGLYPDEIFRRLSSKPILRGLSKFYQRVIDCSRWAATVALRACRLFCSKHGKTKKGISSPRDRLFNSFEECAPPRDASEIGPKLESMLKMSQCQAVYQNQLLKCESAAAKQL